MSAGSRGRSRPSLFTTAETLDPATRALLEDTFRTELFDIYGCTETGPLAWECRAHAGYHVAADGVVLECLGGGTGEAGRVLPGFKGSSQRLPASIVAPRQRLRRVFSSQGSFAVWH